ncbi:MAG: hypothetical protein K8W52_36705 [Deltaproteobacteria bacterium]|nr:hypothetical protein [Deltaproteobacteria bacterium]
MKRTSYAFSTAAIALLTACPGPEGGNPSQLWLAPDGSEVIMRLAAEEPPPW